jgi:hypothetical protein
MRRRRLLIVAAGVVAVAACGKKGAGAGSGSGTPAGSGSGTASVGGGSAAAPDWSAAGSAAAGAMPAGGARTADAAPAAPTIDAGARAVGAPLALERVRPADVPAGVTATGHLDAAWRFTDGGGANYVLFSSKEIAGKTPGPDDEPSRGKAIYVDDWLIPPGAAPKRLRLVRDHVEDCPFDVTAAFHPAALEVTDLDRDGTGEVWFGYEVGCRSDVSPETYKLLALEGGTKYILRGETRVDEGGGQLTGGAYKVDPSFTRGPPAFLAHARALWDRTSADGMGRP